jgi:hypothetical protein
VPLSVVFPPQPGYNRDARLRRHTRRREGAQDRRWAGYGEESESNLLLLPLPIPYFTKHTLVMLRLATPSSALARTSLYSKSASLGFRTALLSTSAVRQSYEDTIKNILVKKDSKVSLSL